MTIQVLPEEIINQIAAGEVIENPSAVIKELVENSIDAKATQIDIEIEDAGLKKIQISDNGIGISKENLLKAPLRHATSKIKSFDDLYNISTMGFRGEALASIFSIAKTKIISNQNDKAHEINSKDLSQVKESAGKKGTTIIVEDIFYNTPARKKYLKSSNLELKSILDIVNRFEIFYHSIKITLKHNGKILVNKPAFKTKEENLYYVLGKELKGNLLEFNDEVKGLKISGFIGKPSNITYSFKKNQYIYVNDRFVKSKIVNSAIYDGFTSNLMVGRHPFYTIFIEIDPEIIDVNVHPTKIEIRFENELEIYELIKNTIEKQFEEKETFKEFETKIQDHAGNKFEITPNNNQLKEIQKENTPKTYYTPETQKHFEVNETSNVEYKRPEKIKPEDIETNQTPIEKIKGPLYETLKEYKILGQLNKTYIIVETPNEMILVDQHVAEEKYYYEKFKENLNQSQKVKSQMLLKPEIIHLTNSEILLYEENKEVIHSLGFETEIFGDNEILVRAVPIDIRKNIVHAQNLRDMLYDILVNKKIKCVEEENYSKIASMACRMSVMAGDELTLPQMQRMVENLKTLKQPFNCPHGRPTFLKYTFYDLEKKFKRVV